MRGIIFLVMIKHRIILTALITILLSSLPFTMIYILGIENSFTIAFARAFNLPIASVNGSKISFRQYYNELQSLQLLTSQKEFSVADLRQNVWNKLLNEHLLRATAREYNIIISPQDREIYFQNFGVDTSSEEYQQLLKIYSDEDSLYRSIVDPLILEARLTQKLITDQDNEAATYIQGIHSLVTNNPDSFDEELEKHLEDSNLQTLEHEILMTETELGETDLARYLEELETGSISQIIGSYDGYRFFKIKNIFEETEKVWQLSEFFVPTSVIRNEINDRKIRAEIKIYASKFIKINV